MTCRLGVLSRASGSAQMEVEHTMVLAAVHGPLIVGGRREQPSSATIEVIFRPFNGRSGELQSIAPVMSMTEFAISE
jgi:ribonuclease PH